MRIIPEYTIDRWGGIWTEQKDLRKIEDGYSPDSLNWITQTNKQGIELRRGMSLLGQTRQSGAGRISGLGVGVDFLGRQVPFFTHGRKIKYYDESSDDTVEVDTSDILPESAEDDTFSIYPYQNLSGSFVFISSPNSSVYKVPVANPGSVKNQNTSSYRGFLKFGQSRAFLYNRNGDTPGNKDLMGLYTSAVDKVDLSQYPAQVENEAVGSSGSTSYSHTLAEITGVRTAMYLTVEATVAAGTETFVDNRDGTLTSNFGGTGTINYATGEIEVEFSDTTTGSVTADYYYEDSTDSGILDFSIANPTDRQPGEGNYFPQFDGGGPLNSVFPLATVFYCFHEFKTWQVSIPVDDESGTDSISSNLPFRERMGVKSHLGAFGGEQGIYFINSANPSRSEFLRLELFTGSTQANIAAPKLLSELIDFAEYAFDKAVVYEWGYYILLACQKKVAGVAQGYNSATFIYNKKNGCWDYLDYAIENLVDYNGKLLAGDPLSNNVFNLFSGFDEDGEVISNYWTSGETNLSIRGQKRFYRMGIEGLIQKGQSFDVELSFDGKPFVKAFTIDSESSYVDSESVSLIGSDLIGDGLIGGSSDIEAYSYKAEIPVTCPLFVYVRVRIVANDIGYVSVNKYSYKDIREKAGRINPENTSN